MFLAMFLGVLVVFVVLASVVSLAIISAGLVMGLIDSFGGELWILIVGSVIYLSILSLLIAGAITILQQVFGTLGI